MATDSTISSRDRELIIIAIGILVSIAVIVGFLLFIKSSADDSTPARSGNTVVEIE